MFNANWFFDLEKRLITAGLDSDLDGFDVIKSRIGTGLEVSADEFARQAVYVVLAGGFSQKTAKKIHQKIMDFLMNAGCGAWSAELLKIFNNKNKINAIVKIWENRQAYRDGYYAAQGLNARLEYLAGLPHIGKITANHLARNLGEDILKYDVWIMRLGAMFPGGVDAMFERLAKITKLPKGYIDVVLWKACQNKFIEV